MKSLRGRARVVVDIHAFFQARDFLHVDTPTVVPSPGMDPHLDAFGVTTRQGQRWLATSPEYQMKRLLAAGHERLYQLGRSYRQDEAGHLHNPEFSILEWYRAGAEVDAVMRDTEQLVARASGGRFTPPFERLTVCEAFSRWADCPPEETLQLADTNEDRFFRLLVDRVEPALARLDAVFLTEYPRSMASLARTKPTDPRVAERFELYVRGVELCNGFGELVDPVEQRKRFDNDQSVRRARGLTVYPVDEKLIDALSTLEPCAGNALGVDRLAMLACGADTIADVMAFTFDEL